MVGYYGAIQRIRQIYPTQGWVAQCRDCGILFVTAASNRGRTDMRCPTGCRTRYEKQSSHIRSGDYYRSDQGRKKKQALNRKRRLISETKKRQNADASLKKSLPALLRYYQWLILLVDGIRMDRPSLELLCQRTRWKVRQRGTEKRGDVRHIRDD